MKPAPLHWHCSYDALPAVCLCCCYSPFSVLCCPLSALLFSIFHLPFSVCCCCLWHSHMRFQLIFFVFQYFSACSRECFQFLSALSRFISLCMPLRLFLLISPLFLSLYLLRFLPLLLNLSLSLLLHAKMLLRCRCCLMQRHSSSVVWPPASSLPLPPPAVCCHPQPLPLLQPERA